MMRWNFCGGVRSESESTEREGGGEEKRSKGFWFCTVEVRIAPPHSVETGDLFN